MMTEENGNQVNVSHVTQPSRSTLSDLMEVIVSSSSKTLLLDTYTL
jgi:hypothetical protein